MLNFMTHASNSASSKIPTPKILTKKKDGIEKKKEKERISGVDWQMRSYMLPHSPSSHPLTPLLPKHLRNKFKIIVKLVGVYAAWLMAVGPHPNEKQNRKEGNEFSKVVAFCFR